MSNFPAFPVIGGGVNSMGMTLRDYFAARAVQGWMANPTATPVEAGINQADLQAMADVAAAFGYMVADAMLVERGTK